MFIIEYGEVEITAADRSITYARLKDGDYVGESCFLDITKRTASAYAVDYVDTYFLTKDNFLKVHFSLGFARANDFVFNDVTVFVFFARLSISI